jgi:hypothetical protein
MSTPRREFLGLLGAGAMATAAPGIVVGAEPAFRAIAAAKRSTRWDTSWTDRIRGRHRAVFDAPDLSEGDPILRAMVWGRQYQEVFGVEVRHTSRVLVLRHHGIHFAMSDAYWARFNIGQETGFNDAAGRPLTVNPVRAARSDVPLPFRELTLEAFQQGGGIVLSCHLALTHYVVPRYVATGMTDANALAAATRDILPGIIEQPSGICAVSVAQEHGCQYVPVS